MNTLLRYVLVPPEVASLAQIKGFDLWCAFCYHFQRGTYSVNDLEIRFDEKFKDSSWIYVPTHTQLIMWLVEIHNIEVQLQMNGMFRVYDKFGSTVWVNEENEFELNGAICAALKLLENV